MQRKTFSYPCLRFSLAILVIAAATTSAPAAAPSPTLLRELLVRHAVDDDMGIQQRDLLHTLAMKTRFKGCVVINGLPRPDCVSVSFAKAHILPEPICASLGDDIIVCDTGFLMGYLDTLHIDGIAQPSRRDQLYRAFQRWVLAHELAHADLRQRPAQFIVDNVPPTQEIAAQVQHIEVLADIRAEQLGAAGSAADYEAMLIAIFNAAHTAKYGKYPNDNHKLHFDWSLGVQYPYPLGATHPDMTLRTASLLADSSVVSPGIRNEALEFLRRSGAPSLVREIGLLRK